MGKILLWKNLKDSNLYLENNKLVTRLTFTSVSPHFTQSTVQIVKY